MAPERAGERANPSLQAAQALYRSLVDRGPAIAFAAVPGEGGRMLFVSPQCRTLGFDPDAWLGDPRRFWRCLHPDDAPRALDAWRAFLCGGGAYDDAFRFVRDDGAVRWLRCQATTVDDGEGGRMVHGVVTDITPLKRAEAEMRAHRDRLEDLIAERTEALQLANRRLAEDIRRRQRVERALFSEKQRAQCTLHSIADAVVTVDGDACVEYLNPAAEALLGWRDAQARGLTLAEVMPLRPVESDAGGDPAAVAAGGGVTHGDCLFARNGAESILEVSSTALRDANDLPAGAVIVFRDVTKERLHAQRLSHKARHDALTGLPNRDEFEARLANALDSARDGARHCVLFIDLDEFKRVNDIGGHAAGDAVLRQVARAMGAQIRGRDTLARLGGDEFGCVLEHCDADEGTRIAHSMLGAVRDFALPWGGQALSVGASIGVVPIGGGDDVGVAEVMRLADAACYAVKGAGRNDVRVLRPGAGDAVTAANGWAGRLADALDAGRFALAVQPIASADGARVHAYEVLVQLDEGGRPVPAAAFAAAAERQRIVADIDRWVIRHTIAALADASHDPVHYVAVSAGTLVDGRLAEFVVAELAGAGVAPSRLGFVLSEQAVMQHFQRVSQFAERVKALGCRIAIDDLEHALPAAASLKTLAPDLVRIPCRLVERAADDAVSRAMIDAIHRVGRAIGAATVARCDDAATLDAIRGLGIDHVQGEAVGEPRPLRVAVS